MDNWCNLLAFLARSDSHADLTMVVDVKNVGDWLVIEWEAPWSGATTVSTMIRRLKDEYLLVHDLCPDQICTIRHTSCRTLVEIWLQHWHMEHAESGADDAEQSRARAYPGDACVA